MISSSDNATQRKRTKLNVIQSSAGGAAKAEPSAPASGPAMEALFDDTLGAAVRPVDKTGNQSSASGVKTIDLSDRLQPLPFGYTKEDITVPFRELGAPNVPADTRDVFVIPCEEGHIVYAPLQRTALLVSHEQGEDLNKVWEADLWERVRNLAAAPQVDIWALEQELNAKQAEPTEAVLIPTEGCNLRCTYCYSSATNSKVLLDVDVALAGLEHCAKEVERQGLPVLTCRFLGGGEPTIHWELITACTQRTRELAQKIGVRSGVSLVTNGVMSEAKARWIGENLDSVTLSIDGPPDIHNRNRPRANGTASHPDAARTLRILQQASRCKVDVRSTVLEDDLPRMREIVEFFHQEFNLKRLCLEPVSICGRAKDNRHIAPMALEFARHFMDARQYGRERGMDIEYSSAVLSRLQVRFCTTMGRHFGLNPDGSVASCSEVHSREDEKAPLLLVGEMTDGGVVQIDTSQVDVLKQRTLANLPSCEKCFARYHCSGGCPVRAARTDGDFFGPFKSMCGAVRTLLRDELLHVVKREAQKQPE
jgi:uncharacterized protein